METNTNLQKGGGEMKEFMSIREVAKTGLISEYFLRAMVKKGECPCVMSGSKVLVNVAALREKLDLMSRGEMTNDRADS